MEREAFAYACDLDHSLRRRSLGKREDESVPPVLSGVPWLRWGCGSPVSRRSIARRTCPTRPAGHDSFFFCIGVDPLRAMVSQMHKGEEEKGQRGSYGCLRWSGMRVPLAWAFSLEAGHFFLGIQMRFHLTLLRKVLSHTVCPSPVGRIGAWRLKFLKKRDRY